MKIISIKTILSEERYLFLKVETDAGIVGFGECGAWGYQPATIHAINQFKEFLIGRDPLEIEHIYNCLTRSRHFRGSVIAAAISGIDLALWDIKGKYFGVPCYELFGGKVRNQLRVYINVDGETKDELVASAKDIKSRGFNAIRFSITHPRTSDGSEFETHSQIVTQISDSFGAIRDAVGWDMDIAVEIHRSLTPAAAIALGREIEQYRPLFLEDPIPDNLEAIRGVIANCAVPVATGERFFCPSEFDSLMSQTQIRYLRPDPCLVGGLTASRKVAAAAELKGVSLVPHNYLGPVSTAACFQLDASIPNFTIQEYPMKGRQCRLNKFMKQEFVLENGFVKLPQGPGLGIELKDDLESAETVASSKPNCVIGFDGAMLDR